MAELSDNEEGVMKYGRLFTEDDVAMEAKREAEVKRLRYADGYTDAFAALRDSSEEERDESSAQRAGEGEAGQDFSRAWSAAVEHGLVDEFADDLDGEESKLRAFLGQLGGVAGPASAEGRRANSGDDSSQGLPDSATAWKSGAPGATGTPSTCLGCGMPVGKAHADDCPYARSRRVNSMQTRIAPVRESAQRAGEPPTPDELQEALDQAVTMANDLGGEVERLTRDPSEEERLRKALEALHFLGFPNPPDWIKREEMIAFARAKYEALAARQGEDRGAVHVDLESGPTNQRIRGDDG